MTENRDIFSISRLNSELRHVLEGSFPLLWVQGEISNLSIPRSGHLYFSLKDSHAQIRCALFKGKANLLRFKPKDGDSVIARAKVALYEPRGDCQLIIESMEPAGEGALQQAFEALKLKLQKEGLFETSLKKELPAHPMNIGIITSSSGAAIRDMLNILSRRHPTATVTIYPCLVQGAEAPADIRQALSNALKRQQDDVIVLTRGGGSIEDLWAFNDEQLARDIAAANIPIVSAVGHEIDFTIADFVADRRAPTPSAAAELISPDQTQVSQRLDQLHAQLTLRTQQSLAAKQKQLQQLEQRLERQHPRTRTQQQQQRLDEIQVRLQRSVSRALLKQQTAAANLTIRLQQQRPSAIIERFKERLSSMHSRLTRSTESALKARREKLNAHSRELHAISPLATLERGYSIVSTAKNKVITKSSDVVSGDSINVRLSEGTLSATVTKTSKKTN